MTALMIDQSALQAHLKALPTLPKIAIEILQSIDNDYIDTATLTNKIANDIGIATRVMRVANSPFFGSSGQISSLKEATLLLGLNSLRGLVTSAAVIQAFPKQLSGINIKSFWEHGLQIAVCAKLLAKACNLEPESAFTAGLLHDIGLLTMALISPEKMAQMDLNVDLDYYTSQEVALFGYDHAYLGEMVTDYWHFPSFITQAIGQHHHAPDDNRSGPPTLTEVLYVASLYAEYSAQDVVCSPHQKEFIEQAARCLNINEAELADLVADSERLYLSAKLMISL